MKESLGLQLKREECVRLAKFFSLSKEVTYIIEKSGTPVEILLLGLEEKGVVQESNVDRLTEALSTLEMGSSYSQVTEFFQKTRGEYHCFPNTKYTNNLQRNFLKNNFEP